MRARSTVSGELLEVVKVHFFIKFKVILFTKIMKRCGGLGSGKGGC